MNRFTLPPAGDFTGDLREAFEAIASVTVQEMASVGGHGEDEDERYAYLSSVLLDEADIALEVYGPDISPETASYRKAIDRLLDVVSARARANRDGRLSEHDAELVASIARQVAETQV